MAQSEGSLGTNICLYSCVNLVSGSLWNLNKTYLIFTIGGGFRGNYD